MEEPVEYRARLIGDALRHQGPDHRPRRSARLAPRIRREHRAAGFLRRHGDGADQPAVRQPLLARRHRPGQFGQIETESKVASSDSVSDARREEKWAAEQTGRSREGASVSVPSNTQIIEVSFASGDAAFARAAAQAYVESFLDYRTQRQAANASQVVSLKNQQAAVESGS